MPQAELKNRYGKFEVELRRKGGERKCFFFVCYRIELITLIPATDCFFESSFVCPQPIKGRIPALALSWPWTTAAATAAAVTVFNCATALNGDIAHAS